METQPYKTDEAYRNGHALQSTIEVSHLNCMLMTLSCTLLVCYVALWWVVCCY